MAKRKVRSAGPQSLVSHAQYLWNERRIKLWIPFLEAKIQELQARIQEKAQGTQAE
jgi:hypothetical protein